VKRYTGKYVDIRRKYQENEESCIIRRLTSNIFETLSGILSNEGRNGKTWGKYGTKKIHTYV
jgi:hypothetical protein